MWPTDLVVWPGKGTKKQSLPPILRASTVFKKRDAATPHCHPLCHGWHRPVTGRGQNQTGESPTKSRYSPGQARYNTRAKSGTCRPDKASALGAKCLTKGTTTPTRKNSTESLCTRTTTHAYCCRFRLNNGSDGTTRGSRHPPARGAVKSATVRTSPAARKSRCGSSGAGKVTRGDSFHKPTATVGRGGGSSTGSVTTKKSGTRPTLRCHAPPIRSKSRGSTTTPSAPTTTSVRAYNGA